LNCPHSADAKLTIDKKKRTACASVTQEEREYLVIQLPDCHLDAVCLFLKLTAPDEQPVSSFPIGAVLSDSGLHIIAEAFVRVRICLMPRPDVAMKDVKHVSARQTALEVLDRHEIGPKESRCLPWAS
jgi:hypothetical protein